MADGNWPKHSRLGRPTAIELLLFKVDSFLRFETSGIRELLEIKLTASQPCTNLARKTTGEQYMPMDVGGAVDSAEKVREIFSVGSRRLSIVSPEQRREEQFQAAFNSFNLALRETVSYMQQLERGAPYDLSRENQLSDLWCRAANAMNPFDADLANRCLIKGNGWLDPKVWQDPAFKGKIKVQQMRNDFAQWNSRQARFQGQSVPSWFPIAGVTFAALTFVSLLYFLIGPELSAGRKLVFDVWVAFCVACSGAFLGGDAVAKGRFSLPFFKNAPIQFSTVGGIAIFVLVFLIMFGANH